MLQRLDSGISKPVLGIPKLTTVIKCHGRSKVTDSVSSLRRKSCPPPPLRSYLRPQRSASALISMTPVSRAYLDLPGPKIAPPSPQIAQTLALTRPRNSMVVRHRWFRGSYSETRKEFVLTFRANLERTVHMVTTMSHEERLGITTRGKSIDRAMQAANIFSLSIARSRRACED